MQEPRRLHLDLPDLPIRFEQGEVTPCGTKFFNRDVYVGESIGPDLLTPLDAALENPPQYKTPTFKSSRAP